MRSVGGRRSQHQLRVRSDVELAVDGALVADRQPADVAIEGMRDGDSQRCVDRFAANPVFGTTLDEAHRLHFPARAERLGRGGPDCTGGAIAEEQIAAEHVGRHVLAPARDGPIAPLSEPGAGIAGHDCVAPVRQQAGAQRRRGQMRHGSVGFSHRGSIGLPKVAVRSGVHE